LIRRFRFFSFVESCINIVQIFREGVLFKFLWHQGFQLLPSAENKTLIFSRVVGFCPVSVILHFGEGIAARQSDLLFCSLSDRRKIPS
jgi:hypothetical protein